MRIHSNALITVICTAPAILPRLPQTILLCACLWFASALCWAQEPTPQVQQQVQQLWHQATDAQTAKDYLGAAALYRKILALDPTLTQAEMNLCLTLHLGGNLQDAVKCFDHVTAKRPNLFGPNFLAGTDYLKLDHPDRALPYLKRAAEESPENADATLALANAELQLRQYSQARGEFVRATELNAQDPDAWSGLGATYLSLEREAEAKLRISGSPFRLVLLAESYLQQGNSDRAVLLLGRVVSAQLQVPCARSLLGFAYLEKGKLDDASQQFALDWDAAKHEGCLLGHLGAAALAARQSHPDEALDFLRDAIAIDPETTTASQSLFWTSFAAAGLDEQARDVMATAPTKAAPEKSAGAALDAKHGRYAACSSELPTRGTVPVAELRMLAMCSYYSGHHDRVMTATSLILKTHPEDAEALYWRIQAMDRLGIAAIARAGQINPDSPSLHTLMGDLLQQKGDLAQAATEYRKAIALKPDSLAARLHLARTLNSNHKLDEAEEQARWVLNASPSDPEANFLMGEILVNRSQPAAALSFLLNAKNVPPEEQPYVHQNLGGIYEENGDTARAIAELKQALVIDTDGSLHYRLGRLYLKTGDRAAANAAMQAARKLENVSNPAARPETQVPDRPAPAKSEPKKHSPEN
jgi:tetratricopeptide (TPR) repeat protein